jgi:hypothetical protein
MLMSSVNPAVPRHASGANSVRDRANSGESSCRVWAGFSHKSERFPSVIPGPRETRHWRAAEGHGVEVKGECSQLSTSESSAR